MSDVKNSTKKKSNIGGYDLYAFCERLAVNYLEKVLLGSFRVVTNFKVEDKQPNYDGELFICDMVADKKQKCVPLFRCAVQIKSLNRDYRNRNKKKNAEYAYQYRCETKIFNATLSRITADPAILFLVDWSSKRIFWKYLSEEYCITNSVQNKDSVMLFFSDEDEIIDVSDWIDTVIRIQNQNRIENLYKENQELLLLTADSSIRYQAQKASDYLNGIFGNELKFIRDVFYPDVWKFGLSYADGDPWKKYGIYQIVIGDNNELIKKYEEDERGLQYSMFSATSGFDEIVRNYFKYCIDKFFVKGNVLVHLQYLPTVVLQEIVFEELDHRFFDKERKKIILQVIRYIMA